MSSASRVVNRLRRKCRNVLVHMRQGNAQPTESDGFVPPADLPCQFEPLEPRLLLDTTGPQIVSHWSYRPIGESVDCVEVTFNEPIDPTTFTAEDVSVAPITLTEAGYYDTRGHAWSVQVVDALAYVADYSFGLRIIDVSNPSSAVEVGYCNTPGYAWDVQVVGTLAYVADGSSGLRIIDVSNPSSAVEVGYYDTPSNALDVQVVGTLAYVADHYSGLRIIDVSDPAAPVEVGYYDTSGHAHGMQVVGTLAYVADYSSGLRIIDVSNPATPVEVGYCDTPSYAYDVQVVGTLAYVADFSSGLRIIDVSNSSAPVEVGYYDTPSYAYDVQVVGTLAYVADSGAGLRIIDVSDPAAPVEVGYYDTPSSASNVQVVGTLAYVADYSSGLRIIEVGPVAQEVSQVDATTYRVQFALPMAEGIHRVFVCPNIADLAGNTMDQNADGIGGQIPGDLYSFDFTFDAPPLEAPGNLTFADDTGVAGDGLTADSELLFTWAEATDPGGIAWYEYRLDGGDWTATTERMATSTLTEGSHSFEVRGVDNVGHGGSAALSQVAVDLTAPEVPTSLRLDGSVLHWSDGTDVNGIWKHQYSVDGGAWIDVDGTSVATGFADGTTHDFMVRAIDRAGNVSVTATATLTVDYGPQIVGHWPNGFVGRDYVEVTFNEPIDPATFTAEDVAIVPVAPVEVGYYDTPGDAVGVQVVGTLAYVADDYSGLRIIDVSNPAAPIEVGFYDTPGRARGVQVVGTLAYVAGVYSGLRIIDVSNSAAPVEVGYYVTSDARDVQVVGTLAYVANGDSGLRIIDVSNPAAPVEVGYYDTSGYAHGVQVVGTLAYVADAYSGLRIIDVSNPAAPAEVGYCDTPDIARRVQVVGTLAYVADYTSGLQIIDVTNPAVPVAMASYNTSDIAQDVHVIGNLAYVSDYRAGLRIIDLSNPAAPAEVVYCDTPGKACGVQVVGSLAYVADYSSGLRIIRVGQYVQEVSQIDAMTCRVKFASPMMDRSDYRVFIRPEVADLAGNTMDQNANGIGGQTSGDVYQFSFTSDSMPPAAPGSLAFADDTGQVADGLTSDTELVFVWDAVTDENGISRYEYRLDGGDWQATTDLMATLVLAEGSYSFEVRAVDNPGNAGPVASKQVTVDLTPPGSPTGLDLDGAVLNWDETADDNGIWKYQYRIDGADWVESLTRQVPTGLAEGSTATFDVRSIDKAGNAGPWALATLTVDYGPRVVGYWPDGLIGASVDYVEVTFDEPIDASTFTAEDVSVAPRTPTEVGFYDTPGDARCVQVVGTLAYVADYSSGLRIIDLSNPAAPVEVGYYDTSGYAHDVQVVGTLAYVAAGDSGLRIIDVSNPATPVEVGFYDTWGIYDAWGSACGVQVVGTLAYVAEDFYTGISYLRIIDVSNPAAPVRVGSYSLLSGWNSWSRPYDFQVVGTLAYVAHGSSGLRIIEVSNPAAPVQVGFYDTWGFAYSVQVVGTLVYVADGSGLRIVDVSDLAAPVEVGFYDTPESARGVQVVGTLAYVAAYTSGLRIVDVSDSASPVEVGFYDTSGDAYGVQVVGPLAYVAEGLSGLRIIEVGPVAQGVSQVDETTCRVQFAEPMGDGSYRVFVGPGIADLAGNTMDQDADGIGGQTCDDVYSFTVDTTAPLVTGAFVNSGIIQRTKIMSLAVDFNEAVVCVAESLTLNNDTTGEPVDLAGAVFDPATSTWDLSGVELANGYYTARIPAGAVEDLAGNAMQDDYTFTFHRLAGDLDGDASVDAMDYITLKRGMGMVGGTAWTGGDLDGDGNVDWFDLQTMMGCFGLSLEEVLEAPVAQAGAVAEPELLAGPVADAPEADVLAIADSLFDNPIAAARQDVQPAPARPANLLPPVRVAFRDGLLSMSSSPLPRSDRAGQVVADVLQLAGPWWPGASARHELSDEPWMTGLATDIEGELRKGWRDPILHLLEI